MGGIPKRVRISRTIANSKRGGSRNGILSGLVSTSARAGVALFRSIKRRTAFSKNILASIKKKIPIAVLFKNGITETDIIETIGLFPSINYLLYNDTSIVDSLNGEGITREELENAGVTFDVKNNANFENFDLVKVLETTTLEPAQIIITILNTYDKIATVVPPPPLSLSTKIQLAVDISTMYDRLDSTKQKQFGEIAENMGLSNEMDSLDFFSLLTGIGVYSK